ncbi:LysE family translocator [Glaciecola sp. KUL10]|jgi:RhtB (resistance to homoserine/threonine) family protein|uniref:LysE family translocator n=1 Tax=Glaciecola sp. (strain KUL10) TaxID=2161813 RepID=UPI000D78BB55|nr:LysE family translocator [Glaciecola sp. KUL10]GBL02922.1 lysine exporter protein LysE/YggA [Glaciecola sp. KUL10]
MEFNWAEFMTIAIVHFFAVASPGPDFAVVLKQSIQKGRTPAIWTSIGIGSGILLHVTYSLVGISILIKATPWLFNVLLYAAAAYLCWIGVNAIRSQPDTDSHNQPIHMTTNTYSIFKCFSLGFITNGLNPKATLFFLSVFTVAISTTTPVEHKLIYGIYMAFATAVWFCALSVFISSEKIRKFYIKKAHIFDRVMGLVLIIMAAMLILGN